MPPSADTRGQRELPLPSKWSLDRLKSPTYTLVRQGENTLPLRGYVRLCVTHTAETRRDESATCLLRQVHFPI